MERFQETFSVCGTGPTPAAARSDFQRVLREERDRGTVIPWTPSPPAWFHGPAGVHMAEARVVFTRVPRGRRMRRPL